MSIFDQAINKDGVLYDDNGVRVHDWLTTEKPNDDSVILYVPKSQRNNSCYEETDNRFQAVGANMKCVDVGALLTECGFEITLAYCNHVCYTLDDSEGVSDE